MPVVLAHRGNLIGPSQATENRVPSVRAALDLGWGIETDIRRAPDGRFYMSHDALPSADGQCAEDFCTLFRAQPHAVIALNIKELGDEAALLRFLDEQGVLRQTFLFDMELIEPIAGQTARLFRALHPWVQLAARVSDRGESIERALSIDVASIIWLDEFDKLWCTEKDVRRLKDAGKTIYAVSPDVHHAPAEVTWHRWLNFIDWGIDGICTDFPDALDRVVKVLDQEKAA
jgi:glycerophosphoryl diester phosphodiesterase